MKGIKTFFFLTISVLFFSCKKNNDSKVYTGTDVKVFNGIASTWFSTDKSGLPDQIALTLDDALMNSLTSGPSADESEYIVNLNPKALELTVFDHLEIDWNPNGHIPEGVYDLPHFDIHFYMVPDNQVQAATDPVKLESLPAEAYLPIHYVNGPSVPKMGKHWIDITSPEFPPKPHNSSFTQTFIYGSYNGQVTFYEPMMSKAWLQSTTLFERDIPQPSKFQRNGYFPTHLITRKKDNKIEIILDKFIYRQAS